MNTPSAITTTIARSTMFMTAPPLCPIAPRNSTGPHPALPASGGGTWLAAKLRRLWRRARDGSDPHVARRCFAGGELQQPLALLGHRDPVGLCQTLQRFDRQRRGIACSLDRPGGLDEAVDQQRAGKGDVPVGVVDDAGAVLVTNQKVVVLGQEA